MCWCAGTVKLMPPAYVKPYVKRGKTDAADAEAICEAVLRPTMRFVAVKTVDQQAVLMPHKARDLLVRQRTMLTNALRAYLAECGPGGVTAAIAALHEAQDGLPILARAALHGLVAQLGGLASEIERIEAKILAWRRSNEASRRLATIPDIGPITTSAIAASVPDASLFRSGRQFAAWLGLTPKAHSSGGKERQIGISKQGDGYLRRLLVVIGPCNVGGVHPRAPAFLRSLDTHRQSANYLDQFDGPVSGTSAGIRPSSIGLAYQQPRRFRRVPSVEGDPLAPARVEAPRAAAGSRREARISMMRVSGRLAQRADGQMIRSHVGALTRHPKAATKDCRITYRRAPPLASQHRHDDDGENDGDERVADNRAPFALPIGVIDLEHRP